MTVHFVDRARLAYEGDIHQAYSGDTIMTGRIRAVVTIEGKPYAVTGTCDDEANLWPLLTVAECPHQSGPFRGSGRRFVLRRWRAIW